MRSRTASFLPFSVLILFMLQMAPVNAMSLFNSPTTATINDQQIMLPNGIDAQVISAVPAKETNKPPIIFLHGSFHGAWCWEENYIPYFVSLGYPCVAFSWRGTGGTPAGDGVTKVKILDHCQDLGGFLESMPSILGKTYASRRPILVTHSMGGINTMKFLQEEYSHHNTKPSDLFGGIVSFCSVPPSGNGKSTMRVLRRSLRDAYRITVGFVLKKVNTDPSICRDCFFGGKPIVRDDATIDDFGISDEDLTRYQRYFERDSKATLDVSDLSRRLPSKEVDNRGRAPFVSDLPPCLVVGAIDDFIVDEVANLETANYFGLEEPIYVDSPHDVMLGRKWKNGAQTLQQWIEQNVLTV